MAGLLHAPLLMLTTLMVALNLSLSPMLVHTLQNDTEKFSVQEIGTPEALEYAVNKNNENSDDLYQDVVVEVKDIKFQCEAAGIKYLSNVILGESLCLKSKFNTATCYYIDKSKREICYFEVYVDQLENQMSLKSHRCLEVLNSVGMTTQKHINVPIVRYLISSKDICAHDPRFIERESFESAVEEIRKRINSFCSLPL